MTSAPKPLLRLARRLHMVAGVLVLLPLLAIIISGTVLIFDQQIVKARAPELFADVTGLSATAQGQDLQTIDVLAGDIGWNLTRLPQADRPYYDIWLMTDERAYFAPGASAFSDRFFWHERPETFFLELHTHLVAGELGETITGIVGIGAVLLVLIGVVIWWPSRRSFSLNRLRPKFGERRSLLRSHAAWGALLALPLGALFVTGVMMVYSDQTKAMFGAMAGAAEPPRPEIGTPDFPLRADWPAILVAAETAFADDTLVMVFRPPPREQGVVFLRTRRSSEWHPNGRSEVYVHPATHAVLGLRDLTDAGAGVEAYNALFPLHATRGGAWWLAPLATLVGLGGTCLLLVSLSAFVLRLRPRPSPHRTQDSAPAE